MNRQQRKKREAVKIRKAQVFIDLRALRYELSEWDGSRMGKFTEIKGISFPSELARRIGKLEAERDLIDLYFMLPVRMGGGSLE